MVEITRHKLKIMKQQKKRYIKILFLAICIEFLGSFKLANNQYILPNSTLITLQIEYPCKVVETSSNVKYQKRILKRNDPIQNISLIRFGHHGDFVWIIDKLNHGYKIEPDPKDLSKNHISALTIPLDRYYHKRKKN
jgi:hypothetical protein